MKNNTAKRVNVNELLRKAHEQEQEERAQRYAAMVRRVLSKWQPSLIGADLSPSEFSSLEWLASVIDDADHWGSIFAKLRAAGPVQS